MIFNKIMSYDINPLSMPRLYPNETYNTQDVLVRKIREDTGVIRFSNIIDFARSQSIDVSKAGRIICESHGLENCVTIVNEEKFYLNESYRQAVIESINFIPMQLEQASYNVPFSILLEYCIDTDIMNNNTNCTEILLEIEAVEGLNDFNQGVSNTITNQGDFFGSIKNKITSKVGGWLGRKASGFINNYLGDEANQDKIAEKVGQVTKKATDQVVGNIADSARDAASPYLKGAMVTAAAGGLLAVLNNTVHTLTDNENLNSDNPGVLSRTFNSLKNCMNTLLGRQQTAPQGQQGIIARLIQKVKNALSYLGKKVGVTS